jgi:hypothetical protein
MLIIGLPLSCTLLVPASLEHSGHDAVMGITQNPKGKVISEMIYVTPSVATD